MHNGGGGGGGGCCRWLRTGAGVLLHAARTARRQHRHLGDEYLQVLSGADPVKEWTRGTWLTQFLQRLPPDEAAQFEQDYARRLRSAYPPRSDGTTLFPFRRLFIVLSKAATRSG
jgi:trans-aconitate methyltransferase